MSWSAFAMTLRLRLPSTAGWLAVAVALTLIFTVVFSSIGESP